MTMLAAESDGPGAAFTLRLSATKTVLSLCKASNVQHLSKIVLCLCGKAEWVAALLSDCLGMRGRGVWRGRGVAPQICCLTHNLVAGIA